MRITTLLCGAGLVLSLTAGCCHHQAATPCAKPAVVGSVPIGPPPSPCCGNTPVPPPGIAPPPGAIPPGTVPPGPPPGPVFTPSSHSGVIVPTSPY